MAGNLLTQSDLDQRLDLWAENHDTFEESVRAYGRELDEAGTPLEVRDPLSWRRISSTDASSEGTRPARIPLRQQFRAEVDSILTLDREDEARLARRIEFARMRLDGLLEAHGHTWDELTGGSSTSKDGEGSDVRGADGCPADLPEAICRRWLELHALRTEMVERNLYLVLINVERYSHTSVGHFDLVQEGAASLFRAVDGFDWRRGLLFRTYAVHWLNQAFRSYLYNNGNTVRVPVYLQKAMKHINDAKNRLGDHKATPEQIAKVTDLAENLVNSAMTAARSNQSMDATFDDEGDGGRLRDLLVDDAFEEGPYRVEFEDTTLDASIESALSRLSDRERLVIEKRYGLGAGAKEHTLAEVAGELGVSLERVRQIQVRALNKLNNPGFRKEIDPWLN